MFRHRRTNCNRERTLGVRCVVCFPAKDRKFAREFVFPGKVHGVFQSEFQILLYSGTLDPVSPFHQWWKELRVPTNLRLCAGMIG